MLCSRCGSHVENGAALCSICGQAAVAGNTRQYPRGRTVIRRSNFKKSKLIQFLVLIITTAAVFALPLGSPVTGAKSLNPAVFFITLLTFFIGIFLMLFNARAILKSFICVCEECVYGVAINKRGFSTQAFEIGFDWIKYVGQVEKGDDGYGLANVIIKCGSSEYAKYAEYACSINEPYEIIKLIRKKMQKAD